MNRFRHIVMLALCGLLACCVHLTAYAQGIPMFQNFTAAEYKGHNQNFDIIASEDGTVYVANFEGLLYFDNAQWRIIHTPGITRVTAIFEDSKGRLWTGGYNYFGYLSINEQGNLKMEPCKAKNAFHGEVQWIWEKNNAIYFLASDKEIYVVRNNSYVWAAGEKFPQTDNNSKYHVDAVINQVEDLENGMKALATNGDGVIFVDKTGNELFRITDHNGLCSNNVSHIDYNRHGLLWGATDNGLFCIGFPSIYSHFTGFEGLHGEVMTLRHFNGRLYAGTQNGLFRLDNDEFVPVNGISHACWQLEVQRQSLLAATSNGVYSIGPNGTATQVTTANTISLLCDSTDGFYCGQMDGIYYHQGNSHKKLSDLEKVTRILRDKQGTIWLQNMYGRVWKSKGMKSQDVISNDNDLSTIVDFGNTIKAISANDTKPIRFPLFSYHDDQGVTWLTNNKGKHLYAYKDGTVEQRLTALVYPLMDYPVRSMLRDDKYLWIGGDKGLNVVDKRNEDKFRREKPNLLLRAILLRGDSVVWGGYGPQPLKLQELSSKDRHIVFTYSIANPTLLLKTQYRTRLNGGSWSAWETDTKEEYSNLVSGQYKFEVQARDAFGQVSDIKSVRFEIAYPFYQRWYMIVLYLLLAAVLIYGLLQLRLRKLEKDKHRLETLVQERTTEVVRLEKMATVGKLTQGLIDRILNPLNYINNFTKLSQGLVNDVKANVEDEEENMTPDNFEDTIEVLDMLKGNLEKVGEHGASTTRTLKAMEEMLKDRSGGIVPMNLTPLLHQDEEMLLKYYEKDIRELGIITRFDIPDQDIHINGNAEQLSKTIMSLLGNAVYAVVKKAQREKYQPQITLQASIEGSEVVVDIQDNGVGIEQTIINKIYDPFFTTKTTGEASGIGLYLSHEIVQNHGGTISVLSEKDAFTKFTIKLPLGK